RARQAVGLERLQRRGERHVETALEDQPRRTERQIRLGIEPRPELVLPFDPLHVRHVDGLAGVANLPRVTRDVVGQAWRARHDGELRGPRANRARAYAGG